MTEQMRLQEIHDMIEKFKALGASDEAIKALWIAALETVDKIVKAN